jgi:two-component system chemotaxis response regulator CheB
MESAAEYHGSAVIGVVLTGMGSDGTEGAGQIKAAGGRVIAEHESTSVVYGMPRSVVEAGLADRVVPLPEVALTLMELINDGSTRI